jgi:hypothetical protein
MLAEEVRGVEIMYIQNTSGNDFSVETTGRQCQPVKLNFTNVEGIEIDAKIHLAIKSSFLQMADGQDKMWNLRFNYPTNFKIKYMGKIVIEVI